jgi:hypothetical protein
MSKLAKSLAAAAGNAGADAPNVEDVFSTYLYDGTGVRKSIDNGINLGDFGVGTSTDFVRATNDYLSRSTDLTGNADGKTFTFSAWVYLDEDTYTSSYLYSSYDGSFGGLKIYINNGTQFLLQAYNAAGTNILTINASNVLSYNTYNHIILSCNLANTANRELYINDVLISDTAVWQDYTDDTIDFTKSQHYIGTVPANTSLSIKGRLAHVFLDHTYRDLSTEANRRLFIDANGGSTPPATLSALNPILYLPMTDGYTIGENLGTGGDFTSNGSPTIINKGTEYVVGSGDGGMVWLKRRGLSENHGIFDSERGSGKYLITNSTGAEGTDGTNCAFTTSGFTLNTSNWNSVDDYTSWTFRKAPRFFDVVTYSGNGVAGRTIAHNLGCDVGMIIVKRTDTISDWRTYQRGAPNKYMSLHLTASANNDNGTFWGNESVHIAPTDAAFTVSSFADVNANGGEYVAYLFAHDPVGEDDDGMIACGSFTTDANADATVTIGWEPQYILYKITSASASWEIQDMMRGLTAEGVNNKHLQPDTISAEQTNTGLLSPTATGFFSTGGLNSNAAYIYMAIRAPMMKEPESGTEVFAVDTGDSSGAPEYYSGFPVDMNIIGYKTGGTAWYPSLGSRLTAGKYLQTANTSVEDLSSQFEYDFMNGAYNGSHTSSFVSWMFKRAKGFFDVVAYTGDGVAGRTVNHSLGVAPEMIWVKSRSLTHNWLVMPNAATKYAYLNSPNGVSASSAFWVDTDPTSTEFTVSANTQVNASAGTYIAYLFATLDGISKVGSYTGNGSSQNIACGFSAGARFVLIKRIDATGDWYIWDTTRGIVSGNDPHLSLNTTSAEVTSDDSIDPESSGFTVNQVAATNINVSSLPYIFLAIA